MGAYGDRRGATPHLDALAAGGLVHDAAYTTMPTTGPAHLSLFTGLAPREHGGTRNSEPMDEAYAARDASRLLRRRGYATAAFVTARLLERRYTGLEGFEIYEGPSDGKTRPGSVAVEHALRWLAAESHRPVFLWVHLYDPHAPYGTAEEKARAGPVDPALYGWVDTAHYADPEERARREAEYLRGVRTADRNLGELVRAVEARTRELLVVAVADHGESLGEHLEARGWAYDHGEYLDGESVAVPLVVAGPGVSPGRSSAPASIRDVYTTLLAAGGVDDATAAAEGLCDLRRPCEGQRVLSVQRRSFGTPIPPDARRHAFATTDGERLVIVGEDGAVARESDEADSRLVHAAREGVDALAEGALRPLDAETRETLRELGYAE